MNQNVIDLLKIIEEHGLAVGRSAALSKMMYDGNWQKSYKESIGVITLLANRIDLSHSIPDEYDNCAGDFNQDGSMIVVIGEQPAGPSHFNRQYPFNDTGGCSGWLNQLLIKEKIDHKRIFWINALHLDGSENDPSIVNQLQPLEVICLGKTAEKWANKNGWKHIAFTHPQYWKRFKSKLPYPFIEHLRSACAREL